MNVNTRFTAKELSKALGSAFTLILISRDVYTDKKVKIYNKASFDKMLKECLDENVMDKLEYLYNLISMLTWPKDEEENKAHLVVDPAVPHSGKTGIHHP